jgi:DME family drug/metabolite transporter
MAITYLFAAATLWGMIGPISKIVFAAGFSPLETAFWRGVLAGIAFIIHWLFKRYPFPTAPRQLFGLVLFGVFGVALLEGSYVYAVHFGGAALASVLLYSAPIWVNLASAVIFKEKIPIRRWTSLSITMAGVLGVCLWGASAEYSAAAISWGLLSGLSYAAFYLAGKIYFHKINPVVVYMIAFPVGSIAILPFMTFAVGLPIGIIFGHLLHAAPHTLLALTTIGLLCTYLAYWFYSKGLQLVDTGKAAIITMVEPLVSVTLAAIMFGEVFTVAGYISALLVVGGVTLATVWDKERHGTSQ